MNVRRALEGRYHAALAMLKQAIESRSNCPAQHKMRQEQSKVARYSGTTGGVPTIASSPGSSSSKLSIGAVGWALPDTP